MIGCKAQLASLPAVVVIRCIALAGAMERAGVLISRSSCFWIILAKPSALELGLASVARALTRGHLGFAVVFSTPEARKYSNWEGLKVRLVVRVG